MKNYIEYTIKTRIRTPIVKEFTEKELKGSKEELIKSDEHLDLLNSIYENLEETIENIKVFQNNEIHNYDIVLNKYPDFTPKETVEKLNNFRDI